MKIDFTDEFVQLLGFIGECGLCIRQNSPYRYSPFEPDKTEETYIQSQFDLYWLSDLLHHFAGSMVNSENPYDVFRLVNMRKQIQWYKTTETYNGRLYGPKNTFDNYPEADLDWLLDIINSMEKKLPVTNSKSS